LSPAGAVSSAPTSSANHSPVDCEALIQQPLPASKVVLTTSCTHVLEMAAMLDETRLERFITPQTRAIEQAHHAGEDCDLDRSQARNVTVPSAPSNTDLGRRADGEPG